MAFDWDRTDGEVENDWVLGASTFTPEHDNVDDVDEDENDSEEEDANREHEYDESIEMIGGEKNPEQDEEIEHSQSRDKDPLGLLSDVSPIVHVFGEEIDEGSLESFHTPFCLQDKKPGYLEMLTQENYHSKSKELQSLHYFENVGIFCINGILYMCITTLLMMGNVRFLPVPEISFVYYLIVFFGLFFGIATTGGYLVSAGKVDVMYTRKTIHILSFVLPFTLFYEFSFQKTVTTYLLTFCSAFLSYVPLISDIRDNSYTKVFYYAYTSFNRLKDYPFTLFWAITQNLATFFVMIPLGYLISHVIGHPTFLNIPIMTVAFGDGMAEIVGKNFSAKGIAHHYEVKAMFSDEVYQRSIEGSLCVFLACLLSILCVCFGTDPGVWNTTQMVVACLILPITATIVEATAWHSWDNALLLLSVGGLMVGVFLLQGFDLTRYQPTGETDEFSTGL